MSENEQKESDNKLESLDASELVKIIKETRSEAAQRRIKEKELETKLNELTSQKEKEETEKKIAEGKKDEVITDLTRQLASYKSKADQFDSYDKSKREKIKTELAENWIDSFETLPLNDLELLATKFNKGEKVPETDGGSNKKQQPGKLEGLLKDLELARSRNDLKAQIQINNLIAEERKKK
jgi:alanyl-tRNA synthetase